jgi:hypothetical protein
MSISSRIRDIKAQPLPASKSQGWHGVKLMKGDDRPSGRPEWMQRNGEAQTGNVALLGGACGGDGQYRLQRSGAVRRPTKCFVTDRAAASELPNLTNPSGDRKANLPRPKPRFD